MDAKRAQRQPSATSSATSKAEQGAAVMSEKQIRPDVVRKVLPSLKEEFRTKDLSEHALMKEAHPALCSHSLFHAWVGKFLAQHCDDVTSISKTNHSRG